MKRLCSLLTPFLLALSLGVAGCAGRQTPDAPPVPPPGRDDLGPLTLGHAGALPHPPAASGDSAGLDDYEDDYDVVRYSDPFEPWNRFWFNFNDIALLKVMKPLHKGYRAVTPARLRSGLSNFSHNLRMPVRFANSILQGKFAQAGVEFGRFFINTVTSLGFARVADRDKVLIDDYTPETATFNDTLAAWGLPGGPYLVWPILGPSSARGTVGMVGDGFMTPQNYLLPWEASLGSNAFFSFNDLERVIDAYETMNRMAVDPYAAVRSGYFSLLHRQDIPLSLDHAGMKMDFFP